MFCCFLKLPKSINLRYFFRIYINKNDEFRQPGIQFQRSLIQAFVRHAGRISNWSRAFEEDSGEMAERVGAEPARSFGVFEGALSP